MFPVPRPSLFAYIISSCRSRAACISAWGPGLYKNQRWGNIPEHRRTLTFAFPKSLCTMAWMSRRASGARFAPLGSDSPVSSWRTGSVSTSLQTMLSMSASRSLSPLWRCIMKPPRLQIIIIIIVIIIIIIIIMTTTMMIKILKIRTIKTEELADWEY